LSNPNVTDEYLKIVIEKCKVDEILLTHKDDSIGEDGAFLSGGEKARVRVAMTLLRTDSSIYI
jgi:ABC-type transport system involved in cytochrome bd biosynthesis fused ATPase/permease subunit